MTFPILDPRLGVERAYGDPVTWREALELLYGMLPDYADKLNGALKTGDVARLHAAAHGLSGAASYCGTVAVEFAAKQLEALCLRENAGGVEDAVALVLHHIDRLIELKQSGRMPGADGDAVY